MQAPKTFKHSGDLGDIIFSLPTVRALGGGTLLLDPDGGRAEPIIQKHIKRGRTKLTPHAIESIRPLLLQQSYISDVQPFTGQGIDYNLDTFRDHLTFQNIADAHLAAFGLPFTERDRAWLTVDRPIEYPQYHFIVSRSVRYAPNFSWWYDSLDEFKDRCAFVGYPREHEIFEYTMEQTVPYLPTPDILTLARVIAGCRQFIGNASLPHAIAEAMKKPLVVELCRISPNVVFQRPGAQYI